MKRFESTKRIVIVAAMFLAVAVLRAEEKPALFDVVLLSIGESKIQAIMAVRRVSWMGLKAAKDLVESAPQTVREGVTKEEGDAAIKALESTQCKAELKPSKVEKFERFELVLKKYDEAIKTRIVATIEGATGLDELAVAKLVETLPATIKKGLTKTEAERIQQGFTDMHADVEIKASAN